MKLIPGMLVRFRVTHYFLTLTVVNGSGKSIGLYTPKEKDPIGLYLRRASRSAGIFLFDNKTCYVDLRYFLPVI